MRRAGASGEPPAVQPYHHRPLAAHGRSEHVHHEAILAFKCGRAMPHDQRVWRAAKLWRRRTILESVAYARPRLRFARRHETIATRTRSAVRDASKGLDALLHDATKF